MAVRAGSLERVRVLSVAMVSPSRSDGDTIHRFSVWAIYRCSPWVIVIDSQRPRSSRSMRTHGVHTALHDTIGMLYYFRKDRRLMGRFILDYVRKRPLRGEAFLTRALFD